MVRYRDVPAAMAWLEEAFGFARHRVLRDEDGGVCYAELTHGSGMVMVGPVDEYGLGKLMVQPGDIGGVETQVCYLFVEDAARHCERAKAAGASIVLDITDEANGGRGYSCRDPEGHVWNFGTYDPWVRQPAPVRRKPTVRGRGSRIAVAASLALLLAGACLYEPAREAMRDLAASALVRIAVAAAPDRHAYEPGGDRAGAQHDLQARLTVESAARSGAEQTIKQLRDQLAMEVRLREAAETASAQTREQLAALLAKQEKAGRTAAEIRTELERAQAARQSAEQAAKQAREQLERAQEAERARLARIKAHRARRAQTRAAQAALREREAAGVFPPWAYRYR
jgi:uncharacterized glyoxalase superfamily protein PhnB